MGPHSHQTERLIAFALVAIVVALALPAYFKITAKFAAHGIELSWWGHIGDFVLMVLVILVALGVIVVVFGAADWIIDRLRGHRN